MDIITIMCSKEALEWLPQPIGSQDKLSHSIVAINIVAQYQFTPHALFLDLRLKITGEPGDENDTLSKVIL